jgi:hypothetical protein
LRWTFDPHGIDHSLPIEWSFAMYRAFVRGQVRPLFEAVNRGDAEPALRLFAPRFEHVFAGDHALGGRRTSLAATREWYA